MTLNNGEYFTLVKQPTHVNINPDSVTSSPENAFVNPSVIVYGGVLDNPVTLTWNILSGFIASFLGQTSTAGVDFTPATGTHSIVIPAGDYTTATGTFDITGITITDDALAE